MVFVQVSDAFKGPGRGCLMMMGSESLAQAQDQQSTLEILQNPAAK